MVLTWRRPVAAATALLAVLAVCGATTGPPAAAAPQRGAVRGRVEIRRVLSSSRQAPAPAAAFEAENDAAREEYRSAVVFLDPPPARSTRPAESRVRMDQKDERFIPHVLAIEAGTTVDFPNGDRVFHNVFSLSSARRFDLGRYAAGRSKAVRFDRPGIVRVFCEIHSHMNAFILVFDHPYFAVTDANGLYRIDGVPPGTYRVTAWYEGVLRRTETVTVLPGGGADANFVLE